MVWLIDNCKLDYDNIMMNTQLIHEAMKSNVKKFIALGTVCSYPKFATIPSSEEEIWDGYPEETNAPYGLSKKMMLVQLDAYRQQFGFNSISVLPTNLYELNTSNNFDEIFNAVMCSFDPNDKKVQPEQ